MADNEAIFNLYIYDDWLVIKLILQLPAAELFFTWSQLLILLFQAAPAPSSAPTFAAYFV